MRTDATTAVYDMVWIVHGYYRIDRAVHVGLSLSFFVSLVWHRSQLPGPMCSCAVAASCSTKQVSVPRPGRQPCWASVRTWWRSHTDPELPQDLKENVIQRDHRRRVFGLDHITCEVRGPLCGAAPRGAAVVL